MYGSITIRLATICFIIIISPWQFVSWQVCLLFTNVPQVNMYLVMQIYSVQKILWITVVHMFMFCYLIKYKTLICVCSTKLTIRGKLLYGGRIVDLPHLKKKHVQSNMVRNSVKLVLFKKWKTFLLNKNITV